MHHNGVAEHMNHTLLQVDEVRSMLVDAGPPESSSQRLTGMTHTGKTPDVTLPTSTMSRPLASSRTPLPVSSDAGHSSMSLPPNAASGGKLFYMCVPGPRRNRAAFRLIHWPTRRFMDTVFDEGYSDAP